MENEELLYHNV